MGEGNQSIFLIVCIKLKRLQNFKMHMSIIIKRAIEFDLSIINIKIIKFITDIKLFDFTNSHFS